MHGRKILVIGCPGSGKSCFARSLAEITGLPLFHLDMLYWNTDRTTVSDEVFLARLRAALAREAWIIDGNYASTLEERVAACDAVFLLDIPAETCLDGVLSRMHSSRTDIPWIEEEADPEFLDFIRSFGKLVLPGMLELLAMHPDKHIAVFHSRDEAQLYLDKLKQALSV